MARQVVLAALLLAGCATDPVKIRPDAHCSGEITSETLREQFYEALEDCTPMIRLTTDTRVFSSFEMPGEGSVGRPTQELSLGSLEASQRTRKDPEP